MRDGGSCAPSPGRRPRGREEDRDEPRLEQHAVGLIRREVLQRRDEREKEQRADRDGDAAARCSTVSSSEQTIPHRDDGDQRAVAASEARTGSARTRSGRRRAAPRATCCEIDRRPAACRARRSARAPVARANRTPKRRSARARAERSSAARGRRWRARRGFRAVICCSDRRLGQSRALSRARFAHLRFDCWSVAIQPNGARRGARPSAAES